MTPNPQLKEANIMRSLQLATTCEPHSSAELIARYRAARQRLYSPGVTTPKMKTPIRELVGTDPATVPTTIPTPVTTLSRLVSTIDLSNEKSGPILKLVSERTGVSIKEILGDEKPAAIAAARQEAMWAVKKITNWSLPRIGRRFNRDHTTVLHAIRRVEERAIQDADLRAFMEAIKTTFC
ncbi:hypothetical protein GGD83_004439 [Rhodoblastus sphagnicola]|nr:hypothetical protein [Rhodoblastus sphagnicola]